jgi:heme A synthase
MAIAIYSLCAITSLISSWLLSRAYWRSRSRLLLWSAISFAGLTLTNLTLWVDKLLLPPEIDLSVLRTSMALIAMLLLLYGLVWETE